MYRTLLISAVLASLLIPLSSAIYIEVPDYDTGIASAGVKDVTNGRYGDVIFATDSGISVYTAKGTWYSVNARHPGETAYGMLAPLNIMATAVTLDSRGHLWIGYPNGLQFQTGTGYEVIQDQQFLKNLNINCMARWGDEVWVATGRAGLHRYHNGNWTWYKPLGPENLGCYTVVSMAVDAASDALVIGSERDGVQMLRERAGEVRFEPVVYAKDRDFDRPSCIAVDASGSVYVADSGNKHIQKFDSSGNLLATWGGRYSEFSCPDDIAIDASGNIYAVDRWNHCIQKFSNSGNLLTTWGSYGTGEGEFRSPAGIAIDAAGDVYVADTDNSRIQKFDSSGNFLTMWGMRGRGVGEFQSPVGVAVDTSGNVYVTDPVNKRIQKFDGSGRYLTKWGAPGSGDGEFQWPTGIAIDVSGNIYVSDRDRIQKFDSSGSFLKRWGSLGTGDGEFLPSDYKVNMAVDASNNIYVIDQDNHRIQKFDGSGNLLAKWESEKPGGGEFLRPEGIAVDAAGDIYVADSGNHRIQKFNSSGRFLATWGSQGFGEREFQSPTGIAIDAAGNIHVTDTNANRIKVFDSSGNPLKTWQFRDTGGEMFHLPSGIAIDASDNIYVVNRESHCVQKFVPHPDTRQDSGAPGYTFVTRWGTKAYQNEPIQGISEVRVNPFGGVYLFNRTTVLRYAPGAGVTPVLHSGDLEEFPVAINDIAATSGGMLLIASDNGIYGWNGSGVALHLTSRDGIRSNVVKKLFVDAYERCWFVVPGNVGYIPPMTGSASLDLNPEPVQTPDVPETTPDVPDDTPAPETLPSEPSGVTGMLEGAWASLMEWVGSVSGGLTGA